MSAFGRSLSLLVHGGAKQGKTVFGASAPKPLLVLDAEGGSRFIRKRKVEWDPTQYAPPLDDGSWEVCIVYVRDFDTIQRVYTWLSAGQHPFRSVMLDSVSEVQQRCIDGLVGTDQMKTQDWGDVLRRMSDLVRKMRDLTIHPTNPLEAIILVAMTREIKGKWKAYVQGALETALPYYIDVIGYLYSEPGEGGIHRKLLVAPRPEFDAGDRTGYLTDALPAGVIDYPPMTSAQANEYPFIEHMLDLIYGPRAETATGAAETAPTNTTEEAT